MLGQWPKKTNKSQILLRGGSSFCINRTLFPPIQGGQRKTHLFLGAHKDSKWELIGDSNRIWEKMADCIKRSAREVLGVTREGSRKMKGAWWWSEEVKGKAVSYTHLTLPTNREV